MVETRCNRDRRSMRVKIPAYKTPHHEEYISVFYKLYCIDIDEGRIAFDDYVVGLEHVCTSKALQD